MAKAKARITSLIDRSEILVLASHDFNALSSICQRGLVFDCGSLVFDGSISEAIEYYKENGRQ